MFIYGLAKNYYFSNESERIQMAQNKEQEERCLWVPKGYMVTVAQMTLINYFLLGSSMIVIMNGIFWFIYRFKFEFFE